MLHSFQKCFLNKLAWKWKVILIVITKGSWLSPIPCKCVFPFNFRCEAENTELAEHPQTFSKLIFSSVELPQRKSTLWAVTPHHFDRSLQVLPHVQFCDLDGCQNNHLTYVFSAVMESLICYCRWHWVIVFWEYWKNIRTVDDKPLLREKKKKSNTFTNYNALTLFVSTGMLTCSFIILFIP